MYGLSEINTIILYYLILSYENVHGQCVVCWTPCIVAMRAGGCYGHCHSSLPARSPLSPLHPHAIQLTPCYFSCTCTHDIPACVWRCTWHNINSHEFYTRLLVVATTMINDNIKSEPIQ